MHPLSLPPIAPEAASIAPAALIQLQGRPLAGGRARGGVLLPLQQQQRYQSGLGIPQLLWLHPQGTQFRFQ